MTPKPAPTEVDIHPLLAGRWSPRAYADKPVTRDIQHQILEAARWAPSSYNLQPWRFIVFDKHADAPTYDRAFATLVPFNQGWSKPVPVLIAVLAKTTTPKGDTNPCAQYDTGAAAMALVLQAHALGLCAHQMSGFDVNAFKQTFQTPDDVLPIAMIAIGHPGDPALLDEALREREWAPRQRLAGSELAFAGAWNKPF
ncbi:nitroreductase family protein [Mycetohabitans sp. B2]|uniref:nitroreductase family protein n=1 Tax=Mycetohabitans sp. B2 TaxID=2841274 RepID=UPI001F486C57|nr:nitroreductase family protein [Mycetohabitans sp. B2]MCF7695499.1 nitroreductase family protein [Mycetohabitans sp. B2]